VCTSECPECGGPWNKYDNYHSIRTLQGVVRLRLKVRRCQNREKFRCAYRPEQEGKWALPQYEFGLVMACVPKSINSLQQRGFALVSAVCNLLERYDELVAISLSDIERINTIIGAHSK